MKKVIKKGVTVTKVLVWNKTGNDANDDVSRCELKFSDGSSLSYECEDVDELEDEHKGIYKLMDDGTYKQIEDWE